MSNNLNIYEWILSSEIRVYLQENHTLSIEEKAEIVCGACRPVEEKYEALKILLEEAGEQEDKELIRSLIRLYDWAFEKLQTEHTGQIFVVLEYACSDDLSEELRENCTGIEKIFHTYGELQKYINTYESSDKDLYRLARIEKWAMAEKGMKEIISLYLYEDNGRAFVRNFTLPGGSPEKELEAMGIIWEARMVNEGTNCISLPLPFRNGDLVRVDIPNLEEPVYGVLYIFEALGRYMHMAYMEDYQLKTVNMTYQEIDYSGWRVINCIHPAQPWELPAGQELLAEISSYMHGLADDAPELQRIRDRIFYRRPNPVLVKTPVSLMELLNDENA